MDIAPRRIIGAWRDGYALDLHTRSSTFLGYDEFGHPRFDNERSEIGQLLYSLKYGGDPKAAAGIVEAAAEFVKKWAPEIDVVVPVTPSSHRAVQPVVTLGVGISKALGIAFADCVHRTRDAPQLKNVFDLDERLRLLDGLHQVDAQSVRGRIVLLFDDLYRSGATMNAITTVLREQGGVRDVFALAVTKTRSHQ